MNFRIGDRVSPKDAMELALELARKGLGRVSPNPPVGCVIVGEEKIIGIGYHQQFGGDHAEVAALKSVVDEKALKDATVYVTLEPCAHHGKTPPCADALANLPIAGVKYAASDPNPEVNGKGLERLRSAGKFTEKMSEFEEEAAELAEVFFHNVTHKEPFVSLKVATSLDGKLALSSGQSQWITGEKSRERSHHLRAIYDAVVIGVGTFLVDNPSLDIRYGEMETKENLVVVLDPMGRGLSKLESSKLVNSRSPESIIWVVGEHCKMETNQATMIKCPTTNGGFLISSFLQELFALGIYSIFVEGGAKTLSAFVEQTSAQRLYQFVAPILIGGKQGVSWTQHWGVDDLNRCPRVQNLTYEKLGDDILINGRLQSLIVP